MTSEDSRIRITADGRKIYLIRIRHKKTCVVELDNNNKKKSSTSIVLPQVSDINLFFSKGTSRANNDFENKIREDILKSISTETCFDEYFKDTTYGSKWVYLKQKWNECLISLCPVLFSSMKIIQKAGRTFNYDFSVTYYDKNYAILCERSIEFKHNVSSISKLPQFLSLPDKTSNFVSKKYAEFYYDNYLDKYIALDEELKLIEKPEKQQYSKIIGNIKYDTHPLFKKMYENEHIEKDKKNIVVNESIKAYLEMYADTIDLTILNGIFQSRQKDKIFVLWDLKQFNIEIIEQDVVERFISIEKNNKIILVGSKYKYILLLRWRNHKGILNPAWQISLKKCVSDIKSEKLN
jgi:hypothetical protein